MGHPIVINVGQLESDLPIIVRAHPDATPPAFAYAYTGANEPIPLKLEGDDELWLGADVSLRRQRLDAPTTRELGAVVPLDRSGPLPVLRSPIEQRVRAFASQHFYGERHIVVEVPAGSMVKANGITSPLLVHGELSGLQLHDLATAAVLLAPTDYDPGIQVDGVTCVYGVLPALGDNTQIANVGELHLAAGRSNRFSLTSEEGQAKLHDVGYLHVQSTAAGTHLRVTGESSVATMGAREQTFIELQSAKVLDLFRVAPRNVAAEFPTGLVSTWGTVGCLRNIGGPELSVGGNVGAMHVHDIDDLSTELGSLGTGAVIQMSTPPEEPLVLRSNRNAGVYLGGVAGEDAELHGVIRTDSNWAHFMARAVDEATDTAWRESPSGLAAAELAAAHKRSARPKPTVAQRERSRARVFRDGTRNSRQGPGRDGRTLG